MKVMPNFVPSVKKSNFRSARIDYVEKLDPES